MGRSRLRVFWGADEISDDISLENGRASVGGWSQYEIHYAGQRIGWLESGEPMDFVDGFTFTIEPIEDEAADGNR